MVKVVVGLALAAALGTAPSPAFAADPDADPWISRDKAFHFDVSAGIAAVGYAASSAWLVDARWKALAIGGGVALTAGAGKELLDLAGLGDPSWKDFTWDAIGTAFGLAVAWGVDLLLGGVNHTHPAFGAPMPGPTGARTSSFTVRF